jgi:uncharacterized damage-inducible protein DinB
VRSMRTALILALLASSTLFAQGPAREQTLAQVFDGQISMIEREVLGLAQKMPAEKYNFAPATGTPPAGTFDGVRTFALQVRHIASVMYDFSSQILGEKNPIDMGQNENGSDKLQTKDQIIAYFKDAIAYSHKAAQSVTPQNAATKAGTAAFIGLHSYDHYGQMVVYARLNGVVPGNAPAPGQGKAAPKGKAK